MKARPLFYVPDVAKLPLAASALRGVAIYVGDGASPLRPLLRRRNGVLIGHASIAEQLEWCTQAQIRQAIFTHCGSPIVRGNTRLVSARVRRLGWEKGVEASIASDGDVLHFYG